MSLSTNISQKPKAALLGTGLSGKATAALLREKGVEYDIFDQRPGEQNRIDFMDIRAGDYSFGMISPGFAANHDWRKHATTIDLPLYSEISLAARYWKGGDLICITGTNGKTTLTEFLSHALEMAGKKAVACGNIGFPFSALCLNEGVQKQEQNCMAICEVSSFQAHDLGGMCPDVALWTNFAEDHLDWHGNIEEYFEAKACLLRSARIAMITEELRDAAKSYGFTLSDAWQVVPPTPNGKLPVGSVFSREPFCRLYPLAYALWQHYGLDDDVLLQAAIHYQPSPHRLEWVADFHGVTFINDSKATNFHAVLGGLRSVNQPIFWVGGGAEKGGDKASFLQRLAPYLTEAHVYGENALELASILGRFSCPVQRHDSLEEAVRTAYRHARPGYTIYFSPGFASFDQFPNYRERGKRFRDTVFSLKNHAIAS